MSTKARKARSSPQECYMFGDDSSLDLSAASFEERLEEAELPMAIVSKQKTEV